MIDTQRLGAYLRALMREDAALARLRTLPVAAPSALAALDPEVELAGRHAGADTLAESLGLSLASSRSSGGPVDDRLATRDAAGGIARGAAAPSGSGGGLPNATDRTPSAALALSAAGPLVRRQLDGLDTGRFLWRGELWPGQAGALMIEEEDDAPARREQPGARAVPAVRMRVELTLAGLGRVHASLRIADEQLDVTVQC